MPYIIFVVLGCMSGSSRLDVADMLVTWNYDADRINENRFMQAILDSLV